MTLNAAQVLQSAKQLEHDQIADLVHELLCVLDGDDLPDSQESVRDAWRAELHSRIDEINDGEVKLVDGRETLALARAKLASRR